MAISTSVLARRGCGRVVIDGSHGTPRYRLRQWWCLGPPGINTPSNTSRIFVRHGLQRLQRRRPEPRAAGETSIRLASFSPSGAVSYPGRADAIGDRSNWSYAALNVGFWNIVGVVGLAVPVASFVESFKHSPVQQPDNSWSGPTASPFLAQCMRRN